MLLQIREPNSTPLPHAVENTSSAIGIDLGTTNSVIAIVGEDGYPQVLKIGKNCNLLPSVISYGHNGTYTVGQDALEQTGDPEYQVVHSIKRLMGTPQNPHEVPVYPLLPKVKNRELTPVEISSHILSTLRDRASEVLGYDVTKAVITVPAYFDEAARTATKLAAQLAGLEVLRLLNEPTAAALAYGLEYGTQGYYAVYDLGGGTFDISVLKLEKGVFQVLATGGDTSLGGDDIDKCVQNHFGSTLMEARKIKEQLSIDEVVNGFTRQQLETLSAPLIDRTLHICRDTLNGSGLDFSKIEGVILVGGATRMPLVRNKVEVLFGKPPLCDHDPDETVALGAALQAHALTKGSDTLLLDVTPLSLGLETMGGLVEKIIPRNTPIPFSKTQEFTTYQNGQTAIAFHIVQGERELVGDCRSLAQFELRGIPSLPAGIARVEVTFTIDSDGLLTVKAREKITNLEQKVEIKPTYGLNESELRRILEESYKHASEDHEERLLQETIQKAEKLILDLEHALSQDGNILETEEIQHIQELISKLKITIPLLDREKILQQVQELSHESNRFADKRLTHHLTIKKL